MNTLVKILSLVESPWEEFGNNATEISWISMLSLILNILSADKTLLRITHLP